MGIGSYVRPRRALGQHWLTDRKVLRRIADATDAGEVETIIEIGAGTGLLTELLAERARRLVAIELDGRLAGNLRPRFEHRRNVAVVEADVLETPLEELLRAGEGRLPYAVAGNLPYYIGTAIVRKFLHAKIQPRWMVVTLQAEVAESMTARPGRMTYLSVLTQMSAAAKVLFYVQPRSFSPSPKVRSAVVRLDTLDAAEFEVDSRDSFLGLVQAGFAAPRKRIRNSLAIGLRVEAHEAEGMLEEAGLDPVQRPAQVPLAGWKHLYFAYRSRAMT